MRRREFVTLLGGATVAMPRVVHAQQSKKTYRIGYLSNNAAPALQAQQNEPVWRTLRELGYVEGANLVVERRYAGAKAARLSAMAAELIALKADLIFAIGGGAADATKAATGTIPIVVITIGDPVGTGLVASLAHPGANVTGVTDVSIELCAKRLDLLRETVPTVARLAVLWNSGDYGMTLREARIESAAKIFGMALQPLPVRESEDFEAAFAALEQDRPDALLITTDALTALNQQRVVDFAGHMRLPTMYELREPVYDGGLMSYGPSTADMAARCAYLVDKILKGAQPSDLPMEEPTRLYFVLNFKTAKALGLTIPPAILARADEVIE